MPVGRPRASWLHQVEAYLKDTGMTFLASAWRWPDGGLTEGYGHDGPGVCLGDGQTVAYRKDMDMIWPCPANPTCGLHMRECLAGPTVIAGHSRILHRL